MLIWVFIENLKTLPWKILEEIIVIFIGRRIINLRIYDDIKLAKRHNILSKYLCDKNFLEPYNLMDMPVVENEERADFYRTNSTIRVDNCPIYLTSCCMYSGIQSRVKAKSKYIGGYLIEFPCINLQNTNIMLEEYEEETDVITSGIFTLNDIIGTSSAAFANFFDKAKQKIHNFFHIRSELFGSINPAYKF